MALSSIQLTIIQAENFFSFVIHYVSFALWGIVVKKSKKILRFEEARCPIILTELWTLAGINEENLMTQV